MSQVPGVEPEPASSTRARPPHPAAVYRRRRIVVALVAALSLVAGAVALRPDAWLIDGSADAASPLTSTPVASAPAAVGEVSASPTCPADPDDLFPVPDEAPPVALITEIDALLTHDAIVSADVGISVWVDGWGEIVSHNPDDLLKPASNQKILTAIGALGLLDPDQRLVTELRSDAEVSPTGVLAGDLVVVGGGDPVLWDVGEHSIYQLAVDLQALGVNRITGSLFVDESRYDSRRIAQGWTDQQIPGDAAPISALTVAANRIDDTYEYLANPQIGNLAVFERYLNEVGITVDGGLTENPAPDSLLGGDPLVSMESPTISELVHQMLKNSDNTTAELLLKEIGLAAGTEPSTLGGLAAARDLVESWCLPIAGNDDDGSGLSYRNTRSAREWRQMLQLAQEQPWWPLFHDGLPVAGEGGTLGSRLAGPATASNLRAKTGTINVAKTLSGTFTTAGGRPATFSVIINDDAGNPSAAMGPTDLLLEAIAAHPG